MGKPLAMDTTRPGAVGWGFALYLAVNAISVWGGVFPFLPMEFQTRQVTLCFYAAQALSAVAAYAVCLLSSYASPTLTTRILPWCSAPAMIAGSCALIASMYVGRLALELVIVAGILLGVGSTGMALLWQRTLAGRADESGDAILIGATALSAIIYFTLYLCPIAVTAYLVPLVFLPLCTVALKVGQDAIDLGQPMFTDIPRAHPGIYLDVMRSYWRSAISAGAIGFVAGTFRAVALGDVTAGHVVNVTSMAGALISAALIMVLWGHFSFHLSMRKAYRWIFPFLLTALMLLPVLKGWQTIDVIAGVVHMLYAFVQMVLLVQCAQAARDRGVCPIFVYAFCSGIMHAMHFIGFLSGWACGDGMSGILSTQFTMASLLAVWLMAMVLFFIWMRPRNGSHRHRDSVEFISMAPTTPALASALDDEADGPVEQDEMTKRCLAAQALFRLSDRECEVISLIASGLTVAMIAEKLTVTENTVRTHAKRAYAKLGVHSKAELSALLDGLG